MKVANLKGDLIVENIRWEMVNQEASNLIGDWTNKAYGRAYEI